MFTALDKDSKETIYIGDYEDNYEKLKSRNLVDVFFQEKVFVRKSYLKTNGDFVRGHFVSRACYKKEFPDNFLIDYDYISFNGKGYSYAESAQHIQGKILIAEYIRKLDWLGDIKIIFEHRIKIEVKNFRTRVIDVAVLLKTGQMLAFECQLSPISLETLEERTYDYQSEGIDTVWCFGGKADTFENRVFASKLHDYIPIFNE